MCVRVCVCVCMCVCVCVCLDPNDFMVMGYSTSFLKPLAFCLSIDEDYAIYYETQKVRFVCV